MDELKVTEWFENPNFISDLIAAGINELSKQHGITAGGLNYLYDRRNVIDAELIASLVREHNQK